MTHWAIKGLVRYVQSGTHAELCGTLFTSNLRETKADIIYNSRLKPSQETASLQKTCGTWDLHHNVSLCLSVCLCVCLNWKGKTVIRKAGNWAGFVWRLYPATLIILGPKASTCFRRVFIVFPVPTMPCEGGGGRCRNWTEKVITWQWGNKKNKNSILLSLD